MSDASLNQNDSSDQDQADTTHQPDAGQETGSSQDRGSASDQTHQQQKQQLSPLAPIFTPKNPQPQISRSFQAHRQQRLQNQQLGNGHLNHGPSLQLPDLQTAQPPSLLPSAPIIDHFGLPTLLQFAEQSWTVPGQAVRPTMSSNYQQAPQGQYAQPQQAQGGYAPNLDDGTGAFLALTRLLEIAL
ncbi:hypothetical protein FKW77_007199 [Venturia effusa]|uniref:Uncharacterized protein n=1 Tax=Venturia effusa TaxID=50376 RepID=A0A517LN45_9PEZI|nr:hypothetical protein FKW77_007199 [Venturia effusa]